MAERRYPLAGLRIAELVDGPLGPASRYLAELGADVVHIAREGRLERAPAAREEFASLASHVGKRWLRADPATEAGRRAIEAELAKADAILIDTSHGIGIALPWTGTALHERHPGAVVAMCSNFGSNTQFSGWQATDPVLHALSGELSRSGIRGMAPLIPPGELGFQCAAVQLAYVVLLALYHRQRTGRGDLLDFSALDGAMQGLDPGYGISGSATMGRPARLLSRDRPARGYQYPIFKCADGYVRICLLAVRQWRGMFEWMGRPEEFASPEYEKVAYRYKSATLIPALAAFFSSQTRADLEAGAVRHGVPLSALLELSEMLRSEHVAARGAFTNVEFPGGQAVPLPNGVMEIDHARMGPAANPPQKPLPAPAHETIAQPFSGLKVLDLGIIVVGGEQGRLMSDNGADVIKLESRAFPDGTRQTDLATGMAVSLAAGHRNKRSLGLNLRDPEGKALFERMAVQADVVLSNFKPGTMESLGIGYDDLVRIKPDIILVESSAFGDSGPWRTRMGYGPLVRAASGLTGKWCYPGDEEGFSDSLTIYPDHVAGRIGIIGVLALLIDRERSGRGGLVTTAQSETVLAHQGWEIAAAQAGLPGLDGPPDAPWGVFQTQGEDDWCAVTVRDDGDWAALCDVVPELDKRLSRAHRLSRRAEIEASLASWLAERDADTAMRTLQDAGVPAGKMLRVADLPDFAYFEERGIFRVETHPHLAEPYHVEAMHVRSEAIAAPGFGAAPLMGEHSEEVMRDWLGLDDAAIDEFIARGVLEPVSEQVKAALAENERIKNEQ